jgi:hypothetical protein
MELQRENQLKEYEKVIHDHIYSGYDAGNALLMIKENHLYKDAGFETFEDYCWNKWQLTRAKAQLKIKAHNFNEDQLKLFGHSETEDIDHEVIEEDKKYCTIPPDIAVIFDKVKDPSNKEDAISEYFELKKLKNSAPTCKETEQIVKKYCAPVAFDPMEFRRVTYLNKKYDDLFEKHRRKERESEFLRIILEEKLDQMEKEEREKILKNLQ